jgi:hypothetical protein
LETIKKAAPFLVLWLTAAGAFAQTAEMLDTVLAADKVSCAQAAGIILPAAGLLAPDAGPDEAFARAREWLPRRAERDGAITLGELSHLVMRAFGLSGGFMYALFPGPRYAYRAMAWRRLLPLRADPGRTVSGGELLYIAGRVLSAAGDGELLPVVSGEQAEAGWEESAEQADESKRRSAAGSGVAPGEGLSGGPEGLQRSLGEFELE